MKLGDFCTSRAARRRAEPGKLPLRVQDEGAGCRMKAQFAIPRFLQQLPLVSLTFWVACGEHGGGWGTDGWSKAAAQNQAVDPN